MNNKRILITGGAGFIGSMLVSKLQNYQNEVFVIDNLSFGKKTHLKLDEDHFFKADIRHKDEMIRILNLIKPHIIIHLAAIHFIPYCNENPYETFAVNVEGTMNLLEGALSSKPEKVIFASTAAVYKPSDKAHKESGLVGPNDIYGLSKLAGEHLFKKFYHESGIDTIVCRFFNAFGPNETNPHVIPSIQKQINSGNRVLSLGNITPKRDFIHTADIAEALILLTKTKTKPFETINIGSGKEYSIAEIVDAFARQIGEKIVIKTDKSKIRKVERMHLLADNSKLIKLGWNAKIDMDEGIRTLIYTKIKIPTNTKVKIPAANIITVPNYLTKI